MADMVSKHKPQRARQGLPMAPWFNGICRAYKAEIRHLVKCRGPTVDLKHAYNAYYKMRRSAHQKHKAREMVNLIDSRSTDAYKTTRAHKHKLTTPIPSDT
eukprot:scaffold40195_cov21-Tisochrysis_lutea.AAC.1